MEGYYSIDIVSYETILNYGKLEADYYKEYTEEEYDNENILLKQSYFLLSNMNSREIVTLNCKPYKIMGDYKPKILDDCLVHYGLFADDKTVIYEKELLYPISQLDAILSQSNSNKQLQAKDEEISNQTNELLEDLDPRTVNNFVRLLLAVNEMKTPLTLSGHKHNQSQLDKINEKLEILGHTTLGDTAYKTLIGIISEKISKGL